ncbi:hypothetical protein L873DRAFT_1791652 [Choiromyces venosus 120613-1]|uniref:Uncharacterized protein n=1 Tax=Choiromyces venosus 120613-1 TaxID=1336337 RepID=A0A3N4JE13_9PEZI|nr:hypothetical protein L873DRAFT_1791652 [Choiromyces venosus 120613-1]
MHSRAVFLLFLCFSLSGALAKIAYLTVPAHHTVGKLGYGSRSHGTRMGFETEEVEVVECTLGAHRMFDGWVVGVGDVFISRPLTYVQQRSGLPWHKRDKYDQYRKPPVQCDRSSANFKQQSRYP